MVYGLVHIDDDTAGISRRRAGLGWTYFQSDGSRITDRSEIERLNGIALPPAYTDAWFCPRPDGHILARGKDAKGRRQYRYHPEFRAINDARKFAQCADFGEKLPKLRAQVVRDLEVRGLSHETVTAAVVRLLDESAIRVGNECYARKNRSYGATTLRQRHVAVHGKALKIAFRAKSGKERKVEVSDARLIRIVRRLSDLPGQHLFQYVDGHDRIPVSSDDVNRYVQKIMGHAFSAKDFRTWAASALAFELLATAKEDLSLSVLTAGVGEYLGNTPSMARNSYIHPALILLTKEPQEKWRQSLQLPRRTRYLGRHERGLIAFLRNDQAASARRT